MENILKERRLQLGLTLIQVAQAVGVSEATVSRWESGDIANMRRDKIAKLANALQIRPSVVMGIDDEQTASSAVRIPVLGFVRAGIPMDAVENIIDYEEIPESMAKSGDHFALQIKGDSMEPRIKEGDVVIVKKQSTAENGEVAVILVNGNDATVKKFFKTEAGIKLISTNPQYDPFFFTPQEVESLPVEVIGRVVELRAKF